MNEEKIRKEFGYEGKSKQWQLGFDALLRHIPSYIKEANKLGPVAQLGEQTFSRHVEGSSPSRSTIGEMSER